MSPLRFRKTLPRRHDDWREPTMTTDDRTRPPGLRGQTCPKDDDHPAHVWTSHLVDPAGEQVWCLGQPADPHRLLNGISDNLTAARGHLDDARGNYGYGTELANALSAAAAIAATLQLAYAVTPVDATVGIDDDGDPYLTFAFDRTTGKDPRPVESAARALDLDEITPAGVGYREWNATVDSREVTFVLYLPGPAPSRLARALYPLRTDPKGAAVMATAAALGGAVALAGRRFLAR